MSVFGSGSSAGSGGRSGRQVSAGGWELGAGAGERSADRGEVSDSHTRCVAAEWASIVEPGDRSFEEYDGDGSAEHSKRAGPAGDDWRLRVRRSGGSGSSAGSGRRSGRQVSAGGRELGRAANIISRPV